MPADSYAVQLEEAKEALQLIVKGQLESSSTLAGSFKNFSPAQIREHIEWLEEKVREEQAIDSPNRAGTRYVGYAMQRSTANG